MNEIIKPERMAGMEKEAYKKIAELLKEAPIPDKELIDHLPLFLARKILSGILSLNEIYKLILNVSGNVFEFGTRWGTQLSLFANFRGIHEPFNANRKIVGFDTFEGLKGVDEKDGGGSYSQEGVLKVAPDYLPFLESVLNCHEMCNPIPHIKKYDIVKGDVMVTLPEYLKKHPETIIAMAYFDLDIYKPTKFCLEMIKDHVTKGSLICFDQLNYGTYPGETVALKEVFGSSRYAIKRMLDISTSYIVID